MAGMSPIDAALADRQRRSQEALLLKEARISSVSLVDQLPQEHAVLVSDFLSRNPRPRVRYHLVTYGGRDFAADTGNEYALGRRERRSMERARAGLNWRSSSNNFPLVAGTDSSGKPDRWLVLTSDNRYFGVGDGGTGFYAAGAPFSLDEQGLGEFPRSLHACLLLIDGVQVLPKNETLPIRLESFGFSGGEVDAAVVEDGGDLQLATELGDDRAEQFER